MDGAHGRYDQPIAQSRKLKKDHTGFWIRSAVIVILAGAAVFGYIAYTDHRSALQPPDLTGAGANAGDAADAPAYPSAPSSLEQGADGAAASTPGAAPSTPETTDAAPSSASTNDADQSTPP
jgi:hypothetical protein